MDKDGQERTGCDLKMKNCGDENLDDNSLSLRKQKENFQKRSEDGNVGTDVDGLLGQIE